MGRVKSALEDARAVIRLKPDSPKVRLFSLQEALLDLNAGLHTRRSPLSITGQVRRRHQAADSWSKQGQRRHKGASNGLLCSASAVLTLAQIFDDEEESIKRERAEKEVRSFAEIRATHAHPASQTARIGTLPQELVINVAKELSPMDRYRCTRVCRTWRHAIDAAPDLWDELDLRGTVKMGRKKVAHWLPRLGKRSFRRLALACKGNFVLADVTDLLSDNVGRLETFYYEGRLDRPSADKARADYADVLINFLSLASESLYSLEMRPVYQIELSTSLPAFLEAFPALRHLECPGATSDVAAGRSTWSRRDAESLDNNAGQSIKPVSQLRTFQLENIRMVGAGEPAPIYAGIKLFDCQWPHLETLSFTESFADGGDMQQTLELNRALLPFPSLHTLRLCGVQSYSMLIAADACPLRHLALRGARHGNVAAFMLLVREHHATRLEHLDLSHCALPQHGSLTSTRWPNLLSLNLSHTALNDAMMEVLATSCPLLERLDVRGCAALTGGPVMRLVVARGEEGVKELNIDQCALITNEAVAWLRTKVPRVTAKMGDGSKEKSWRSRYT